MHKNWFKVVTMALAVGSVVGPARAALESNDAGYTGPVIDLSSRLQLGSTATERYGYTVGPIELPGMVFTRSNSETNTGQGAVLGQGQYLLSGNGAFGAGAVYAGLDGAGGYMQFMLTGDAVSEFGAYVTYSTEYADSTKSLDTNPFIAALDRDGNVLESWDLAFYAPVDNPLGFNVFEFRGIARDSADIYGLRFGNAFLLAAGSADGSVPTVRPPVDPPIPAVPEPSTYALMLVGLAAVAAAARRNRTAVNPA